MKWRGKFSVGGKVIGTVFIYNPKQQVLSGRAIEASEVKKEQDKAASALRIADLEYRKINQLAGNTVKDESQQAIFDFYLQVIRDPSLRTEIYEKIREELLTADQAVFQVFRKYIQKLEVSGSTLFKERIPDVVDIRSRLIAAIQQKEILVKIDEECIVVCRELSPSEIILFARQKVKGIVAEKGGLTSHAAIIARSMGIPFVFGVDGIIDQITNGARIIVDGEKGEIITNPDEAELDFARSEILSRVSDDASRKKYLSGPVFTKCGTRIRTMVNLELEVEVDKAAHYGPEGVGLMRTEAFFLDQSQGGAAGVTNGETTEESRDQQRFIERSLSLCKADGDYITIRLYDVGGDKLPGFSEKEENPALGLRGIRLLMARKQLLMSQLGIIAEALRQSAGKHEFRVLIPMVSSVEEVRLVRELLHEVLVKAGLKQYAGKVKTGAMIEVPSAALIADILAREADFLSIGTNDLMQYMMAADRTNTLVSGYYDEYHPALWRSIKSMIDAAGGSSAEISICGEMASVPKFAALFAALGIRSLSMAAPALIDVRKMLSNIDLRLMKKELRRIFEATSADEVRAITDEILSGLNVSDD
ncbi:MAG: phosphoenolpyruvate--protein phosphotransferase [Balneolales bacterium]|nr:phosphoenolpyruvate--protein phosphotransferase [Balneolales bacterium]